MAAVDGNGKRGFQSTVNSPWSTVTDTLVRQLTTVDCGLCYVWPMQQGTFRKTKIIATLGPATDSAEMIARLMNAGVNLFRLNVSHASHDWVRRVYKDTTVVIIGSILVGEQIVDAVQMRVV